MGDCSYYISRGTGETTLSAQREHHDPSYVTYPDPRWTLQSFAQSRRGERLVKHLISPSTPRRFSASVTFSPTSIKSTVARSESPGKLVCYALVCHWQPSATNAQHGNPKSRDGARTRLLHDRHVRSFPLFGSFLTHCVPPGSH